MQPLRRAVIDVGTNSVKLLVGEVLDQKVDPLLEKSEQTRLGKGFYPDHRLQQDAIDRTAAAVARFAEQARSFGPERIRVIGTSAARDAQNRADLARAIETASGLPLEIISGRQEAEWVFAGVTTDPRFAGQSLMILDVGGGSAEFILGKDGTARFQQSFPLGTVRLLEQVQPSDPPVENQLKLAQQIVSNALSMLVRPALEPALNRSSDGPIRFVGTGGTATILAAMKLQLPAFDRERIEAVTVPFAEIEEREHQLWSLPLAERRHIPGLPPNRADVILMGVVIFAEIMRHFGFGELCPTTRGLRFAGILAAGCDLLESGDSTRS